MEYLDNLGLSDTNLDTRSAKLMLVFDRFMEQMAQKFRAREQLRAKMYKYSVFENTFQNQSQQSHKSVNVYITIITI